MECLIQWFISIAAILVIKEILHNIEKNEL